MGSPAPASGLAVVQPVWFGHHTACVPGPSVGCLQGMTLKAMAQLLPDVEEEAPLQRKDGEYGLDDLADE